MSKLINIDQLSTSLDRVKTYVATKYAPITHYHGSNQVTSMAGYSKASSTSAISTSDNLNTAIGKLERALDDKQASGSYSLAGHNHDDKYYTESEIDTKITTLETSISNVRSYTDTKITQLINGAPGALDTLDELAAALNDDSSFAATITNQISNKADKTTASTTANGLMSSADKTKLNGIAEGAQVNQNAFSNVAVGSTTIAADSPTDTLTLIAGSNVTLTPNASGDSVTIAASNSVYTHPTTSGNKHIPSGGSSGQFLGWSADGTATWVANPNTDSKVKTTEAATTKLYVTGCTGATTAALKYDTGVYLDTTAGMITATTFNGNATTATTASTANKVANSLTIKLNGTAQTAFNGSGAVTFNITPASIGAATSASVAQATDSEINTMLTNLFG